MNIGTESSQLPITPVIALVPPGPLVTHTAAIYAMKRDKKANSSSTNVTAVLMTDCSQMENLVIVNDLTTTEIDNAVNYFKKLYSNEGRKEALFQMTPC